MALAQIGPQLERAEPSWAELLINRPICSCSCSWSWGCICICGCCSAFCELELIANPVSGRRTNCLAASRVSTSEFPVCSLQFVQLQRRVLSCSSQQPAASTAAAPQANDQLCQSRNSGEATWEETRHGSGSGSDWGPGQPHTLAVGAASFEFTAKYVAILCFARIWLRQAPLFDRNECECAFVSKAPVASPSCTRSLLCLLLLLPSPSRPRARARARSHSQLQSPIPVCYFSHSLVLRPCSTIAYCNVALPTYYCATIVAHNICAIWLNFS